MKTVIPPLKSQGIKTKLVPWILDQLPDRKGRWIEPFMGTGVVGFNANYKEAIFNDVNPHIIAFYRAIQAGEITPQSVERYLKTEGDALRIAGDKGYDHYRAVRSRFNDQGFAPLDFLFLNRAGFNGMMRFSKTGKWNIPFCQKPDRFRDAYRTKISNQVKAVSVRISKAWEFRNEPFADTILSAKKGDLIYCDPPYFGRYADYFNTWKEADEERLFEVLRETPARFILSTWHHNEWRSNTSVEKYWSQFHMETREHFYHAGAKEENRNPMIEALVMNFTPPKQSTISNGKLIQTEFLPAA